MTRRKLVLGAMAAAPRASRHAVAQAIAPESLPYPERKRAPGDWPSFALRDRALLRWPAAVRGATRLRLTLAIDDRRERRIEARASGRPLGTFDIRFSSALQPCEIPVQGELREVELRLAEPGTPLWFLSGGAPAALLPHALIPGADDPIREFESRLLSLESLQPFGWLEGCVTDALFDYGPAGREALRRHLDFYFPDGGGPVYEDPASVRIAGRVYGVEGLLPFAALAQLEPGHRALRAALDFATRDATLTTEGCYTMAYPLAVIGALRQDGALMARARRQLQERSEALFRDGAIHQRSQGEPYRNWARGVAWFLLGYVRSMKFLGTFGLDADFRAAAEMALARQRPDGLWTCFLDEPGTGVDTSGSAGIAAALALGVRLGLLNESYRDAARTTLRALAGHLTPDGFLGGVAQLNRNGEALQRSGYRVLCQFAMGLMGQLARAV